MKMELYKHLAHLWIMGACVEMLNRIWQCVAGLGEQMERKLWQAGYLSWDDVKRKPKPDFVPSKVWQRLKAAIPTYEQMWATQNYAELVEALPSKVQWRLIPAFLGRMAYLDIETTGLSQWDNYVTTIAVFDGTRVHTFVHGQNLDDFPAFIRQFSALVTFFGKGFDVPFLRTYFRKSGLELPAMHFDTCFLLRRLGLKGGLKRIEHHFGLTRGDVEGIDGELGVILWWKYVHTHNPGYLNTLLAYNIEDVLNLDFLLRTAYNGLVELDGIPASPIPIVTRQVQNPYHPDLGLLAPLRTMFEDPTLSNRFKDPRFPSE